MLSCQRSSNYCFSSLGGKWFNLPFVRPRSQEENARLGQLFRLQTALSRCRPAARQPLRVPVSRRLGTAKKRDTRRSAGCRAVWLRSQKSLYLKEKHPWVRQVSGHGFSRAARVAKQLLPCAAGPRSAAKRELLRKKRKTIGLFR